jgi:ribose transport system substrate-binding protein
MKRSSVSIVFFIVILGMAIAPLLGADPFPKSWLWSSGSLKMVDTAKFKKSPPYTIGFSNASISNPWRVFLDKYVRYGADLHKDLITKFYVTDANDKPDKQIADVEDLIAKGVDLLIISAATEAALDPVVTRATQKGIPVVCVDRRVNSDNFVSFVTSSNFTQGRAQMLWICEVLKGKGNVLMLGGVAGASPAEERVAGAKEILAVFPGIKVLDLQYANWSSSEGKRIMSAMIQKYGKQINAVWGDGPQNQGAIEALKEANMKIPITGDHTNGLLVRAQKWGYPAMSIDYPTSMGLDAVEIALKVLQGTPVPFVYEVPRSIITTVDTENIKSDMPWKTMARSDWPDTAYPNNLPKKWLPY